MSLSSISFIQGLSLGLEHIDADPEDGTPNMIVFDCLILRFIIRLAPAARA